MTCDRLWLINRAREDDIDLVSQSPFRHKVEKHEFLELFSDFDGVLQQYQAKQHVPPLVNFPHLHLFSTPFHASDSRTENFVRTCHTAS
jgi:hypothetical protein